jgi:allophanate hydrolase subunit 2
MKPGDKIKFKEVSLDTAQALMIEQAERMRGILE